jgi:hypothetical protein
MVIKSLNWTTNKTLLNNADPEVIARVATEILNTVPLEDAEKK